MTPRAGTLEVNYCWRCRQVPARLFALPCPSCLSILLAEYDAWKTAHPGQLRYLQVPPTGPVLSTSFAETAEELAA